MYLWEIGLRVFGVELMMCVSVLNWMFFLFWFLYRVVVERVI